EDATPAVTREERAGGVLPLDRTRHAHVVEDPDHMRPDEAPGGGAQRLVEPLDDLGLALVDEHVGTPHRANVERLVTSVQDQNMLQLARKIASPSAVTAGTSSRGRPRPAPRETGIPRRARRRAP